MFLAEKTVKNYVSNLLSKLGMERRTQAAVFAARLDPLRERVMEDEADRGTASAAERLRNPRPSARLELGDDIAWALVEAAPDGIVCVDEDGTILVVNGQTEVLFGYGRDELLGRLVEELLPARLRAAHRAAPRGTAPSRARVRWERASRSCGRRSGRLGVPGRDQPEPARDRTAACSSSPSCATSASDSPAEDASP